METGDRFNQLKYAMNTRMFLLIAGILLIFNSVTSNIPYGMRFFAIAQMVSEYEANGGSGNKEVTAPEGKAESPVSGVESVVESVAADLQESAVESVAEDIQENAAAGTGFLTLVTLTGGFALAGGGSSAYTLDRLVGTGSRR